MKKKLYSIAALLVLALSLTACGNSTDTYGGYSAESIESSCVNFADSVLDLTSDQAASYYQHYASLAEDDEDYEPYVDLFADWMEIQPELGSYVGISEFDIAKSGKTVTATLSLDYTGRDCQIVYVFNANTMDLTGLNAQLVYSLGETMEKAALNTVMGILIVFAILILISLIIYAFRLIPKFEAMFKKKTEESTSATSPIGSLDKVSGENLADDLELVAVITAAIAASTGAATDSFVVRSIKRR